MGEPLVFEQSKEGRHAYSIPQRNIPKVSLEEAVPKRFLRSEIEGFPQLSEPEVIRHFLRLSHWNYGVDTGFYPLGSCTMKYNPKVNEELAKIPAFVQCHPYQPEEISQGILELMYNLALFLAEISGMDRVTLQPAAGAHGELVGMMMIRAFHEQRGDRKKKVLIPDTAHGTNPASSSLCGYEVVPVKSGLKGIMTPDSLKEKLDDDVAALMMTIPNTLGLFEENILEITQMLHGKGALVYCDGANLNALMGKAKLGDLGVDVVHFNLHKTFSAPHGGGGPGAGPVGVKENLAPFLPVPIVNRKEEGFFLDYNIPHSIGKVRSFYGNIGVLIKAYCYILSMGEEGLKKASEMAVLNANYLQNKLKRHYHLPQDRNCMHEFVITDQIQRTHKVQALDIAKRLMDYGFHPPTIYFPLVYPGAMMIEPTETETKETLDSFAQAMEMIAKEVEEDPQHVRTAPHKAKLKRLNEVKAAREPKLRWK